MTTLTTPARPGVDASPRPVPWRRMAWVTWRQHRFALAGVAVFLGLLAAWLWFLGLQLHQAYAAAITCHPANSNACGDVIRTFDDMNNVLANGFILQAVPALIGAFVGAPVLAREMETGTFRYAWTQGFGRWRWALAKLVLLAVTVAAAAGAFSALISWYYQPYFAAGNQNLGISAATPFASGLFDLRGVGLAAWTLAALAIGALAGMLIRRVVPAMVAALAAYTGLAIAAGSFLRQHYMPPQLTSTLNVPGTAWIMSQWWTRDGRIALTGQPPMSILQQYCAPGPQGSTSVKTLGPITQCLSQHGYTQWTSYQPASRFWAFQCIEAGWLLALSALLIAAAVWLVRRRAV